MQTNESAKVQSFTWRGVLAVSASVIALTASTAAFAQEAVQTTPPANSKPPATEPAKV